MRFWNVSWRMVWLYTVVVSTLYAAPFVAPSEGPVPFRRDRVPLDPLAMVGVARSLLVIVDEIGADTAEKRRAVAQMLAVALALDPGSERAKKSLQEIPARAFKPKGGGEAAKQCQAVWQVIEWLETPEAGIDGQSLAACLKDVMVVADPRHARAAGLRELGEQAAWTTWVAPRQAYEEPQAEERWVERPDQKPEPTPAAEAPAAIRLAEASLPVLLWKRKEKEVPAQWLPVVETLRMKASLRNGPVRVSIGSRGFNEALRSLSERVEGILQERHEKLPANLFVEIRADLLDASIASRERHALSGVCALLADAAISGVVPEAMVLGVFDANNQLRVSSDFWTLVQALSEREGMRWVIPAEAEEIIGAFLAMERPDFFLKNEVMIAKTMDDLVELSAKNPNPSLAALYSRFREIADKQGVQDARTYVGNTFVKQRLIAIHEEEPRHLSAKMLAIQSAGKRPTKVVRLVTASDLGRVMNTMKWVRDRPHFQPGNRDLAQVFDDCRAGIDRVAKLADKEAQDLIEAAITAANTVRDLDRSARSKRGTYGQIDAAMRAKKSVLDREYDRFDQMVKEVLEPEG
jgi:hypothetical protein